MIVNKEELKELLHDFYNDCIQNHEKLTTIGEFRCFIDEWCDLFFTKYPELESLVVHELMVQRQR